MTEQLENTAALPAPAKTPGRGPAMLALLLALIALGLAVFLGYRLVYLQPFVAQAEQAEQLVAAAEQRLLAELDTGCQTARPISQPYLSPCVKKTSTCSSSYRLMWPKIGRHDANSDDSPSMAPG